MSHSWFTFAILACVLLAHGKAEVEDTMVDLGEATASQNVTAGMDLRAPMYITQKGSQGGGCGCQECGGWGNRGCRNMCQCAGYNNYQCRNCACQCGSSGGGGGGGGGSGGGGSGGGGGGCSGGNCGRK